MKRATAAQMAFAVEYAAKQDARDIARCMGVLANDPQASAATIARDADVSPALALRMWRQARGYPG